MIQYKWRKFIWIISDTAWCPYLERNKDESSLPIRDKGNGKGLCISKWSLRLDMNGKISLLQIGLGGSRSNIR